MAKKVKATVKTNVTPKAKSKAIKPKMGRGTGGLFTSKILADVKAKEKKKSEGK